MADLSSNLKALPTRYTTWVVVVVTAVAAYWLQLAPAEQAELLAAYPWLEHLAPLAALVSFVVARIWPQGVPTPPADDAGDDTVPDEHA